VRNKEKTENKKKTLNCGGNYMLTEKFDMFIYKYLEEFKFPPGARRSTNIVDLRGEEDPRLKPLTQKDFHDRLEQGKNYIEKVAKSHQHAPVQNADDIGKEFEQQTLPLGQYP
jgi:hypothetical protein